jgi:hypothetical protein
MKLFESRQIKKLTEATMEELEPVAEDLRKTLEKIIDPKTHTIAVKAKKFLGDASIDIIFSKYRKEDNKWSHGLALNDPALLYLSIDQNPNGTYTVESGGHTRYLNHKRAGVGVPNKKTGDISQIKKHLETYFKKLIANINNENYN